MKPLLQARSSEDRLEKIVANLERKLAFVSRCAEHGGGQAWGRSPGRGSRGESGESDESAESMGNGGGGVRGGPLRRNTGGGGGGGGGRGGGGGGGSGGGTMGFSSVNVGAWAFGKERELLDLGDQAPLPSHECPRPRTAPYPRTPPPAHMHPYRYMHPYVVASAGGRTEGEWSGGGGDGWMVGARGEWQKIEERGQRMLGEVNEMRRMERDVSRATEECEKREEWERERGREEERDLVRERVKKREREREQEREREREREREQQRERERERERAWEKERERLLVCAREAGERGVKCQLDLESQLLLVRDLLQQVCSLSRARARALSLSLVLH
jgi:hypothetical protein